MVKKRWVFAGIILAMGLLVYLVFPFSIFSALFPSPESGKLPVSKISLPQGFKIEVFASEVEGARSMALSPNGTLFVGSRSPGKVYAVIDENGDYRADRVLTVARGLNSPNGVAFRNGTLYVAEISRILKFEDIESSLQTPPEPEVVTDRFPQEGIHGWKFIKFGPDDKLYVPVGAPCNTCEVEDPFASITRMGPDGSQFEIYARGVRNTVGFDWHPTTGELWFTDNGRDWLGDNVPPDELNRAPEAGMHFGYPYCHGKDINDPDLNEGGNCSRFAQPEVELGPHVAALGMRFYTGDMFPQEYHQGIFIAEHGSWNRKTPIGYRVTFVEMDGSSPVSYRTFADGWLQGGVSWGRPVDVLVNPDGSIMVSDDKADAIYRISYGN